MNRGGKLNHVLYQIAELLEGEKIDWAVGGSCLLAKSGIVDAPRDIDILVLEEHAVQTLQVLAQVGQQRVLPSKAPFLTKYFYQIVINDIEVDVMGGLRIQHDQGIFENPFDTSSIVFTQNIDGTVIPYTYLEDWYVLYALMPGREHRVKDIEEYWQHHHIEHPARLTQLLTHNLPKHVVEKVKASLIQFIYPAMRRRADR